MWIIGTALLVVATVALGWTLGISPQLKAAATAAVETVSVNGQNVKNQADLEALKKQFSDIDSIRSELDTLNVALPRDPQLATFIRQINTLATQHSVTVQVITPAAPTVFASEEAAAEAPAADAADPAAATADPATAPTDSAATPADTDDGEAAAAEEVARATANVTGGALVTIGMTIVVGGSYDAVLAFTQGLQQGDRLFMATGVSVADSGDTATAGSAPYVGTIDGLIYVIP
jgi:Tfp pilus assembly protein PilO